MTAKQDLWDVAVEQHGFVSARDAADLGIEVMAIQMLVRRGQLEKVAHGVYRFPTLPPSDYDQYQLAVMWTGAADACLSHETALLLYDISNINPTKIHVTVPAAKRIRRAGGENYRIHYADLDPDDVDWIEGIRATKFIPTLRHCRKDGVPTYILAQAAARAQARGMLPGAAADEFSDLLAIGDQG